MAYIYYPLDYYNTEYYKTIVRHNTQFAKHKLELSDDASAKSGTSDFCNFFTNIFKLKSDKSEDS